MKREVVFDPRKAHPTFWMVQDLHDQALKARGRGDIPAAIGLHLECVKWLPALCMEDRKSKTRIPEPGKDIDDLCEYLPSLLRIDDLRYILSVARPVKELAAYVPKIERAMEQAEKVKLIFAFIEQHPGCVQSELHKTFGSEASGLLYWASKLGLVRRILHGRSYQLFRGGTEMPLTSEELLRIREEEQARFEVRRELEAKAVAPVASPAREWKPGVAAVLSLVIPGAGQMYKGQTLNGIAWLVLTVCGYLAFVFPGLVLHVCCIVGAASKKKAPGVSRRWTAGSLEFWLAAIFGGMILVMVLSTLKSNADLKRLESKPPAVHGPAAR